MKMKINITYIPSEYKVTLWWFNATTNKRQGIAEWNMIDNFNKSFNERLQNESKNY